MDTTLLIVIVSTLANLGLAALIIIHGRGRQANQYFVLMTLAIIGWIISNYFSNFVKEYQYALFWNKLIFVTTAIAGWAFLIFSDVFPDERRLPERKFFWTSFSLMSIIVLISLSHYLVKDITIKENVSEIIFGWGIYLYIVFLLGCLLLAFTKIVAKYLKSKDILIKKSIRLVGIGMAIFLIFSIGTNLLLPVLFKNFELTNWAPFYTFIFLLVISVSILRYGFLEIRVILTEFLVGVIGLIILVQALTAPTIWWKIFGFVLLGLFAITGSLLIRYTFREIKRREEIEKISQLKSEFLAITSHQLRTPLTAIKGYLSMVLGGTYGEIPERMKKPLENVFFSNERLIRLINDFLNVSRIEAGKIEMEFERADIGEIIEEVMKEMEIKAKEKGLYLKFEKPKEILPKTLLDKEKIRQVIMNLIDNAIKYTQEGGIKIKVEILKNRLRVGVIDTGEGMTEEEKSKLFESFSRGTAGIRFWTEGAGLGLYIAKRLVELHNGRIWAESEGKGKGSKFFFELPIR